MFKIGLLPVGNPSCMTLIVEKGRKNIVNLTFTNSWTEFLSVTMMASAEKNFKQSDGNKYAKQ